MCSTLDSFLSSVSNAGQWSIHSCSTAKALCKAAAEQTVSFFTRTLGIFRLVWGTGSLLLFLLIKSSLSYFSIGCVRWSEQRNQRPRELSLDTRSSQDVGKIGPLDCVLLWDDDVPFSRLNNGTVWWWYWIDIAYCSVSLECFVILFTALDIDLFRICLSNFYILSSIHTDSPFKKRSWAETIYMDVQIVYTMKNPSPFKLFYAQNQTEQIWSCVSKRKYAHYLESIYHGLFELCRLSSNFHLYFLYYSIQYSITINREAL